MLRRWAPVYRGRGTRAERIIAYQELFRTGGGVWVSIPGKSRFVEVAS